MRFRTNPASTCWWIARRCRATLLTAPAPDTSPRNPAPIRLGLSLQDQALRCCSSPSVFASGSDTTVISYNFSSSIANLVLTDDNSAPASGDFKIRIVNASPNLGPADVYIVTPGTALTTVSPTLSNLGFGATAAYQSWPPATTRSNSRSVGQKFAAVDTGTLTFSCRPGPDIRGFEQSVRRLHLHHASRCELIRPCGADTLAAALKLILLFWLDTVAAQLLTQSRKSK